MASSALLPYLTGRAETLYERLARPVAVSGEAGASPAGQVRLLSPWSKAFARGNGEAMRRRLEWDDIDPARAALAFRPTAPGIDVPAAPWTRHLIAYERVAGSFADRLAEAGRPYPGIPFVELWLPWVELGAAGVEVSGQLTEDAVETLRRHLLGEVAALSELAAYELFDAFRRDRETVSGNGSSIYSAFVARTLKDPLTRLYRPYPTLARQTVAAVNRWRDEVEELAGRYRADRVEIGEVLGSGGDPGRIRAVGAGLSDRHDGRQVLRLELESGLAVIYKPRGVELENALAGWCDWWSAEGFELTPRVPRVLAGEGYGWVEEVRQEALAGDEAQLYYRRAGALLAMAYVLRARDLHGENLVATRQGPVVIDAEMFLQPHRLAFSTHTATDEDDSGSCLESGLVLEPGRGARGEEREWAGLRPEPRRPPTGSRRWHRVNLDSMAVEAGEEAPRWGENVLWVDAAVSDPEDHAPAIAEGFEQACRFVVERKRAILSDGGPLGVFRGSRVRILLRPSQDYARVLSRMSVPRNQRSGLAPSLLCEALLGAFAGAGTGELPLLWPLAGDERSSLLAGDVPRFTIPADSAVLESRARRKIEGYFETSGLEAVRRRIETLDDDGIARQLEILRRALAPRKTLALHVPADLDDRPAAVLPAAELRRLCRALACSLAEEVATREDLDVDGIGLAEGHLGPALFLAAASRLDGLPARDAEAFRLASLRRLEPVELQLSGAPGGSLLGLGGFSGRGSLLYGLTWLGRMLEDPAAPRLAATASRLDPGTIEQDRTFDVEGGAAGCLLGLLAFHDSTGDESALDLARRCGEHLLAHQEVLSSAGAAWRTSAGVALAGWAHGAAGIARALTALAEATGEERYRVAAAAAVGFERALFDPDRGNWPVLVAAGGRVRRLWPVAWCHGAAGVALSRLMLPETLADAFLEAELRAALTTTAAAPPARLDHLCCGNFGRGAVLLAAAERRGDVQSLEAARRITAQVIDRARRDKRFTLSEGRLAARRCSAGFLKGLSGIGYHLLRISGAELPDVLALELPREARHRWEAGA